MMQCTFCRKSLGVKGRVWAPLRQPGICTIILLIQPFFGTRISSGKPFPRHRFKGTGFIARDQGISFHPWNLHLNLVLSKTSSFENPTQLWKVTVQSQALNCQIEGAVNKHGLCGKLKCDTEGFLNDGLKACWQDNVKQILCYNHLCSGWPVSTS